MKERYGVVYIPLVPPTASTGAPDEGILIDAYARPYGFGEDPTDGTPEGVPDGRRARDLDRTALIRDWDRVAAPLRRAGLYRSGCMAAAAVRRLGLKKPALAIYQTLYRQAYIETLRLHTGAEPTAATIEGRSGELALALALLLAASRPPGGPTIVATGQLGQPEGNNPEAADIAVSSVGQLPEKLQLIERLARAGKLPRGPGPTGPVWLFAPATFAREGALLAVETLPETARLAALGITVFPVNTLGEAAERLQARRARWMWQDSAWLAAIAGGVAGLSLLLWVGVGWPEPPARPAPELAIVVGDRNHWTDERPRSLQRVEQVYPGQTLGLRFSRHAGEFRYLLRLYGDGAADLEDVDANFQDGGIWARSPPDEGFIDIGYGARRAEVILFLVSDRPWSAPRRRHLANLLATALEARPELPPGVHYRFETQGCKPLAVAVEHVTRGSVTPPPGASCMTWAHQLLTTFNEHARGRVRLSGYAFQVAPY